MTYVQWDIYNANYVHVPNIYAKDDFLKAKYMLYMIVTFILCIVIHIEAMRWLNGDQKEEDKSSKKITKE